MRRAKGIIGTISLVEKEQKLTGFIEKLKNDANVLAVIVFGSYARGNSRPDSDIDLVVILKEGYKRAAEDFEGQTFEIIYTTEKAAIEYWQLNKHDAVGLWDVAKVIFDLDGTGQRLKEFGETLRKEKPMTFDTAKLDHLRFDARDSIKSAEKINETDPATASLLIHKKAADLADLYFDIKQMWRPAPKQQLESIKRIDSEMGALFTEFYETAEFDRKAQILTEISTNILG